MEHDLNKDFIERRIKMENVEHLRKIKEEGNGAILVTGHIGNWEMGAMVMGLLGHPVTAIALPHKERPVNDLFNKQRENKGLTVVTINVAIRRCMEALKRNEFVALVADRDFTHNGEILNFLGRDTLIPKGAAIFAYKTGAPILPIFLTRNSDGSFTVSFQEPIRPPRIFDNGDVIPQEDMIILMKKYADVIASKIKEYPDQWMMFREFWVK
jgi:KDO2-lipid IV(A) lauroyltransferase